MTAPRPQTIASAILDELRSLADRQDGALPNEMTVARLRREIAKVATIDRLASLMLSAALDSLTFNVEGVRESARRAFAMSVTDVVGTNIVIAFERCGAVNDALAYSELLMKRLPHNPRVLKCELATAFDAGQFTRAEIACAALIDMQIEINRPRIAPLRSILARRGHSEQQLTDLLACVRSFIASRTFSNSPRYKVHPISEADGDPAYLFYSFSVGKDIEENLKLEDELFAQLDAAGYPCYKDGTVLISFSEKGDDVTNEHQAECVV